MYEVLVGPAQTELASMDALAASFNPQNSRARAGDLEAAIAAKRADYAKRPGVSCQSKFRLRRIDVRGGHLHVELGPTDYFEYLATNHDQELNAALVDYGRKTHGDPDACLSNAIGNLAIVETTDAKVVALQRSEQVATFTGRVDLPGGHPEPDNLNAELGSEVALKAELFAAIGREIAEELGVSPKALGETTLIGVIRNLEDGRKPEMIFHVPVRLAAEEVLSAYQAGGNRSESTALLLGTPAEFRRRGADMTAPSHAAFELWAGHAAGASSG